MKLVIKFYQTVKREHFVQWNLNNCLYFKRDSCCIANKWFKVMQWILHATELMNLLVETQFSVISFSLFTEFFFFVLFYFLRVSALHSKVQLNLFWSLYIGFLEVQRRSVAIFSDAESIHWSYWSFCLKLFKALFIQSYQTSSPCMNSNAWLFLKLLPDFLMEIFWSWVAWITYLIDKFKKKKL